MLNKIKTMFLCVSIMMCSFIIAQDVTMGLGVVTDSTAEITMSNSEAVAGFQFNVEGADVTAGSGGLAGEAGFNVSAGGEVVLGFSFTGDVIPAGSSGVLTNLEGTFSDDICLSGIVISDADGDSLDWTAGEFDCDFVDDCIDEDADGICDDVDDCVGEFDECGVCNGDGIADGACDCSGNVEDCAGVCGGDAAEDGACYSNNDQFLGR